MFNFLQNELTNVVEDQYCTYDRKVTSLTILSGKFLFAQGNYVVFHCFVGKDFKGAPIKVEQDEWSTRPAPNFGRGGGGGGDGGAGGGGGGYKRNYDDHRGGGDHGGGRGGGGGRYDDDSKRQRGGLNQLSLLSCSFFILREK